MQKRVTRPDLFKLAAESSRDPRTVEQVLKGKGNDQSRSAVIAAAKRLDMKLPDPQPGE